MDEVLDSQDMNHFMVFQSRRKNISVIFVTQNIYQSGRYSVMQRYVLEALKKRSTSKNSLFFIFRRQYNYFVIFYQFGADVTLISNLNRSLFLGRRQKSFIQNCFKKIANFETNEYEKYLLIDANQKSKLPLTLRIRTNIFAEDPIFFMLEEE